MKGTGPVLRPGVIQSDPAWEASKAARVSRRHDDAIQIVVFLQRQYRSQWSDRVAASPVDLYTVLRTLTDKRIPFVLTGAHGISGWTGKPRNTQDVDILVRGGRNHARALKALKAIYPQLEVHIFVGVAGFFLPGEKELLLDITYPHRLDIADTLANPVWTYNAEQALRYRVPSLENALANKYGAMLTLTRAFPKRLLDMVDFANMVLHSYEEGRQPVNLQRLEQLGELVWPGGGGKEILTFVQQVKAGVIAPLPTEQRILGKGPDQG